MMIIFGFLAVVFLVVGISFIINGFRGIPSSGEVIGAEDYEIIQKDLTGAKEESDVLRKQLDFLAVELEDSKTKLDKVKSIEYGLNDLKNKEMQYQNEIQHLNHDLDFLYSRADTQAGEAVGVLENLSSDNEKLRNELEALKNQQNDASLEEIKVENEKLQSQIDETSAKFASLENELAASREKSQARDSETESSNTQLVEENLKLKSGIKDIVSKIDQVEEAFAQLKQQKETQLIQANRAVDELNKKLDQLTQEKGQNSEKMAELENMLVKKEVDRLSVAQNAQDSSVEQPLGDQSQMQDELNKMKRMNDFMVDQEKLLQLELTKYRARAVGLQSICQELRKQLNQDS